jgi:hypothetical protein
MEHRIVERHVAAEEARELLSGQSVNRAIEDPIIGWNGRLELLTRYGQQGQHEERRQSHCGRK